MGRLIDEDDVKRLLLARYEGPEYIIADIRKIPTAETEGKWIPVEERLPEREEWIGAKENEHYLRRMEIAVASDTTEYFLVYYDGYKWFDKLGRTYCGVRAWRIHEPYKEAEK